MNWKFWQRKPKEEQPSPLSITFTVDKDGNINSLAHFPPTSEAEVAKSMAYAMAAMCFLLHDGQLIAAFQSGIAVGGAVSGMDGTANIALDHLSKMIRNKTRREHSKELVVSPTAIFSGKQDEEDE